jgi:hypothetical protein
VIDELRRQLAAAADEGPLQRYNGPVPPLNRATRPALIQCGMSSLANHKDWMAALNAEALRRAKASDGISSVAQHPSKLQNGRYHTRAKLY